MKATTRRLDHDLDLIAVGAASGLLWRRDQLVMVGLGEACRLPLARDARGAASAQDLLAELSGPDEIDLPGSGPVAFTSMPFAPDEPAQLIVPELTLVHGREGRRWVTSVGDAVPTLDEVVARCRAALAAGDASSPEPAKVQVSSPIPPEMWRDDIVATARERIRAGELTKAVLARELVLEFDSPLDVPGVIERMARTHASAMLFAVEGFVGASPELLVARVDDVVRAHPLAGTAPRGSDPSEDQRLAAGLLVSTKDRWEHRITIEWLLDELLPFCSYVDAEPEPVIVTMPNVHHLGTRVEGRLSEPAASVLELVAALHPTPAVGGDPQQRALALIADLEGTDRGHYAGPTGWVDGRGNGSFCVAIRSAQLDGSTARLHAGVGVVADSDPDSELAETRAKFQAMLPVILRL